VGKDQWLSIIIKKVNRSIDQNAITVQKAEGRVDRCGLLQDIRKKPHVIDVALVVSIKINLTYFT
jgi:hypothetical protein